MNDIHDIHEIMRRWRMMRQRKIERDIEIKQRERDRREYERDDTNVLYDKTFNV